ncbi:MAG: hypothetical protein ACYDBT_06510 [Desulfobulbaceae bacterium]
MKLKASPVLFILIAALFFFANLTASKAVVQHSLHPAQGRTKGAVDNNGLILDGSSAFEDLTEAAFMGNSKGIALALQTYEKQSGRIEPILPAHRLTRLRELIDSIWTATNKRDYAVVALQATEAYRTLIESLDRSNLSVPMEVALLDYAGFKFQALLMAKPIAWDTLRETGNQARDNWLALKEKISDRKLGEAMDLAIEGMNSAQQSRNAETAVLAARIDLALVDLLEASFIKTPGLK